MDRIQCLLLMLECGVTTSEAASRPIQQTEPFLRDFKHLAIAERVKNK